MEKKQAIKLISDTFNAKFDENRFSLFIKNLLNDVEPKSNRYSGQLLWDDHKDHINSYKRIGKYIDPKGEPLDILIVEVKTLAKLERARTSLRNFVIKHLSKFDKDYALVAFYAKEDDGIDWRFSFIKLEHQSYFDEEKEKVKIKKEFTPAKRYSFLVGEYEQSHTAKTQLLPLLQNLANNPTVEDLENAFSVEKVTDEFFSQYKELYVKLYEHFNKDTHIKAELNKANIDNARFTKKLLGQIVFLYFLQKKGWLGVPQNEKWGKGQKRFIQNLFDKSDKENYFKDYLQPLFYEALAKERTNEKSFYERFNCRIPFLNGGLFEAEYKWETANITIPKNLFRNQEKNKAGDIGTGVLDVFDRYNFTIKEDEPLDKEVAIDPEMLGKVFENMLEITERKSKGAFYTPREIVHYMCQESLIHYLDNSLNSSPPFEEEYPKGEVVKNLNNLPYLKTFRKKLRNNLTPAEAALWKLLQKKQLDGRKFRRQHSVVNYILDFYCPAEKLAIELDEQGHFEASQAEYDNDRDLFLKHCGIKVLRFENKWIWENTEGLLQAIKNEFGWWKKQPPCPADTSDSIEPPRPADTPPLEGGELVPRADIETYIRKGHNALENDKRVAKEGKETKRYKYILPQSIRENADLIDQKLTHIKICDPAIGSGAFPVGLLHELVNAQLVIKPHFTDNYLNQPNESRYIYRLKRHIIQESIYGVDIDASAIDIARLRLWLSLVVDEDDFDPIETLPNLDYKIVCGNSLISRYDIDMPIEKVFKEFNKDRDDKMDLDKYKALVNAFMDESDHDKKEEFRTLIAEIKSAFKTYFSQGDLKSLNKLKSKLNEYEAVGLFGANKSTAEKKRIKELKATIAKKEKERNDIEQSKIYENAIEWRFEFPNLLNDNGDFVGFDVVIGNPPYGELIKEGKDYFKNNYISTEGKYETYKYFIERGIQL